MNVEVGTVVTEVTFSDEDDLQTWGPIIVRHIRNIVDRIQSYNAINGVLEASFDLARPGGPDTPGLTIHIDFDKEEDYDAYQAAFITAVQSVKDNLANKAEIEVWWDSEMEED